MAELTLAALVERGLARAVVGDDQVRVAGIRHDSRACEPGDLFAAIAGEVRHGKEFAPEAIARGAVAVLCDHAFDSSVPVLLSDDVLVALSSIARELYDDPTANVTAIGVTGTNGKTTTAYLIEAVIAAAGQRPAVLGTVNFRAPGAVRAATHTTPMADDMMRLARWTVGQGATHLVLEVSSHGLHMHRADGVRFTVAAFTNLTRDHLDYHGDFASYGRAKRRLFDELNPTWSVINVDDAFGAEIAAGLRGRVLRCSRHAAASAEIRALAWSSSAQGISATVASPRGEVQLHSPLVGEHNVENLLVAFGCGIALGFAPEVVAAGLSESTGAPGRLERVPDPEVGVFVDYAHTPDALERVLRALRPVTKGRLFVVFGCGGDRDRGKRPMMGKLAVELADIAIATSDNPRTEAPDAILAEVEAGIVATGVRKLEPGALATAERGYLVQVDRRAAIELAVAAAHRDDVVLIAGKGHEKTQIIGKRHEPFDDCAEAQAALARRSARARGEGG